ncbi:MAG: hypothetical protein B7Y45_06045 [Sphingomonas sp. 28-66-16]|nr:MAG: hypothetical protein B7Y45_06045 [Sphingomonas sp. 28-66-16]
MFTTSALMLQAAFGCILAAAIASRGPRPRVLIAIGAALLAARAAMPPRDPVTMVWTAIIILVCGYLLGRRLFANAAVRFSDEESMLRAAILADVLPSAARHLIDQGWWLDVAAGETLTRQGMAIETVVFLSKGSARVLVDDCDVGTCTKGDLIGEATALTGAPATATVELTSPARLWCIKASTLRAYIAANPEIGPPLERSFRNALRAKLVASNQAVAGRRGGG